MENRYNNSNDFERFLKQNADQYRMFPSEKVWKGIHNRLHTRRRWYGLGLAFLLLTTGVVTWVMLVTPSRKQQLVSSSPIVASASLKTADQNKQPVIEAPIVAATKNNKKPAYGHTPFPAAAYTENIASADEKTESGKQPGSDADNLIAEAENPTGEAATDFSQNSITRVQKISDGSTKSIQPQAKTNNKAALAANTTANIEKTITAVTVSSPIDEKKDETSNTTEAANTRYTEPNLLTIESVVNSYKKPLVKKKLTWQAYLIPTVSYRALTENQAFINAARAVTNSNSPAVTYLPSDLESVVNHKPDVGFQLGFSAGYPLSKRIKLLSGLQFNINKYDIQAYNYSNEVATVALSTAAGRTNTVSTITNYRIEGGYNRAKWLRNFYFTASVPIGFEVKLVEKKKSYIGITATAQPTYILDNRSYLVSTDYKNYVEIPSLTRKWNINTGFEVFAGIKAAGTEWRIGPQVRYQTLSSYKNKYPIEERLFDFGLKLGVVLK